MYELVYFNWSGTKEEMKKEGEIVKRIASKYGVELVGLFVPSSEWKHAVLYKSKDFESFLKFQKEVRKELPSSAGPTKLELLVDTDSLY